MRRVKTLFITAVLLSLLNAVNSFAGTQGHYYPGVMNARDIILPPKGVYTIYYDPLYYSNDLKNENGNSLSNVSMSISETAPSEAAHINANGNNIPIMLSAGLSADINTSMTFTTQQLVLLWSAGWKFLGADFGMLIAPSLGYVNVEVDAKAHDAGTISIGDVSETVVKDETIKIKSSKYGFGDLLAQPFMLDWRGKRYDLGFNYGFYAPTGAYSKDRLANVGMGFWTQQFQAFAAYYFDDERKTVLVITGTYNLNSQKYDQRLAPGQSMTLEYSLSHYLNDRVEIAVSGYDQWQIAPDTGSEADDKDVFYQIHGIGGQIGGWAIKDKLNIVTKCIYEYYGVERFRGILGTLNITWVF